MIRHDLALADAPDDDRARGAIQTPLAADRLHRQVVRLAGEVEHDIDAGVPPCPARLDLQQADALVLRVASAGVDNYLSPTFGQPPGRPVDGEPGEPPLAGKGVPTRLVWNGGREGDLIAAAERVKEADRDRGDPVEVAPGREGTAVRRGRSRTCGSPPSMPSDGSDVPGRGLASDAPRVLATAGAWSANGIVAPTTSARATSRLAMCPAASDANRAPRPLAALTAMQFDAPIRPAPVSTRLRQTVLPPYTVPRRVASTRAIASQRKQIPHHPPEPRHTQPVRGASLPPAFDAVPEPT